LALLFPDASGFTSQVGGGSAFFVRHHYITHNMKKWTVGELQALRGAWRFMVGLGALAIIVSVGLLILYLNLSPEQKSSDVHKHDVLTGIIIILVAGAIVVAGWKLRSYLKKCERETGQSSKPFGWVP
jgi:hypothetical protein